MIKVRFDSTTKNLTSIELIEREELLQYIQDIVEDSLATLHEITLWNGHAFCKLNQVCLDDLPDVEPDEVTIGNKIGCITSIWNEDGNIEYGIDNIFYKESQFCRL